MASRTMKSGKLLHSIRLLNDSAEEGFLGKLKAHVDRAYEYTRLAFKVNP